MAMYMVMTKAEAAACVCQHVRAYWKLKMKAYLSEVTPEIVGKTNTRNVMDTYVHLWIVRMDIYIHILIYKYIYTYIASYCLRG